MEADMDPIMGFQEYRIRTRHHEHNHHHYDNHHSDYRGPYHQGHSGSSILMSLAASIIKNKALLTALIIACVVVVILGIVIVIKLVPWVFSLFGYLEQGGVNSIVDMALRILRGVWEGAGKG
jgi:hypothetical protein